MHFMSHIWFHIYIHMILNRTFFFVTPPIANFPYAQHFLLSITLQTHADSNWFTIAKYNTHAMLYFYAQLLTAS